MIITINPLANDEPADLTISSTRFPQANMLADHNGSRLYCHSTLNPQYDVLPGNIVKIYLKKLLIVVVTETCCYDGPADILIGKVIPNRQYSEKIYLKYHTIYSNIPIKKVFQFETNVVIHI